MFTFCHFNDETQGGKQNKQLTDVSRQCSYFIGKNRLKVGSINFTGQTTFFGVEKP